jgi:tetratricopeptide (TPR) repeat protein
MDREEYDQARENFAKILELDPENQDVVAWRKKLQDIEEQAKIDEQAESVRDRVNEEGWNVYKSGNALFKAGHYRSAIAKFNEIFGMGTTDPAIERMAAKKIRICKAAIKATREPLLAKAKQNEQDGNMPEAFELYQKATRIDPSHPEGYAGMNRIRGVLHERAKKIYTEAVLAESYSDFAGAQKKFEEVLKVSPPDDIYHERAERKLARFIHGIKKEE